MERLEVRPFEAGVSQIRPVEVSAFELRLLEVGVSNERSVDATRGGHYNRRRAHSLTTMLPIYKYLRGTLVMLADD